MSQTHVQLGSGIYTYGEAARLLNVHFNQVKRWSEGYIYPINGVLRSKEPVLQHAIAEPGLLTFHDLIELFFVREFRKAGVNMEDIREAARLLAERLNTHYPFACSKVETDGVQILTQAGDHYENVVRRQQVFEVVRVFFRNIDFGEDCLAEKWWPLGRERLIVLDPRRSFGAPIDFKSGIRTDILHAAYKAEGDMAAVADWYDVSPEEVEAAVEFEEKWKKAA